MTSALRSGVKRKNSITCEPALLRASPGRRSEGATGLAIAGMAEVVYWWERPQVALTKAEQSTPVTSLRGWLWVQILPARTPRSIFARI